MNITRSKIFSSVLAFVFLIFPYALFAQGTITNPSFCTGANTMSTIADILNFFTCLIIGSVIPLIMTLAVATFIWGVVQFVIKDDTKEKEKGKQFMIYGIIGLFVMTSFWGIVKILTDTFGTNGANVIPTLPN